jgi:hypothetical protein
MFGNSYGLKFQNLSDDPYQRQKNTFIGQNWTIQNILPIKLYLYNLRNHSYSSLGFIDANSTKMIEENQLQDNDVFHAFFSPLTAHNKNLGILYNVLDPVHIRTNSRTIMIGNVQYTDTGNRGAQAFNMHADINGVHIINRLSIPIELWYKENLVAIVAVSDGTEANVHTSSPASYFFSNWGEGLNIGDELIFKLKLKSGSKFYTNVVLNDNFITNIHVGLISVIVPAIHIQDAVGYRVDQPNFLNIKYFKHDNISDGLGGKDKLAYYSH